MNYVTKRFLLLVLTLSYSHFTLLAQQKKDTTYISKKRIVGVWQLGSPRVGDGLNQNFEFYSNGNFVLNLGNYGEDAVSTINLKGRYRLVKDEIYFTITSKVVVDGAKITTVDPGINYGISAFEGGKKKEIKEINPEEITDPAYIVVVNKNHIKINSEDYYKIDPGILKEQHFSPLVN